MARYIVEFEGEEEVVETQWYSDTIVVEAEDEIEAEAIAERELSYVEGLTIIDAYEADED